VRYLLAFLVGLSWSQSLSEAETALERENYERVIALTSQILSAKPKELYAYYLQGMAYLGKAQHLEEDDPARQSLIQKAQDAFQMAQAKNPKYPYVYLGLAEIERLRKNPDKARENLAKAEEYGAAEVKVLIEAARIHTALGGKASIDKATFLLSKAKSKDPQNAAIRRALGDLWSSQGVLELAIQNYQEAVQIEPQNPENYFRLGLAYAKAKALRDAGDALKKALELDHYQEAVQIEPQNPENYFRLGLAYAKAKALRDAGEALKKALELDPGYAPAYRELGEVYFAAQKYQQAKEYYQKYVTLRPELPARVRYATFLYLSKDYKAAIQEIEAVHKDTFSITLQRLLGYSLFEDQQYEAAIKALDLYFQKQKPEKVIAKDYLYYAKALDKAGRDADAVTYYQKAIEKDPSLAAEVYPEMANALNSLGRYKEAANALQKAIEKNPSLQNYFALGKIYYKLGQTEKDTTYFHKAIQAFSYVVEKKPDLVPAYTELGRCAANLDPESTEGRAKPYYEKVIELASQDPNRYKNDLIEAYAYLGYYYYLQAENSKSKEAYQKSYEAYKKLRELDPQNAQAAQALPYLETRVR